jgi:hypothetical protein
MTQESKQVFDLAATSTGIMALVTWLPPIAAVFTIVWYGIRIWESDTVQSLRKKR